MTRHKDYYRILHVQRDAPAEVIQSSYRTMMQKLKMHPDLGGDHDDAALVNEAFRVLNNAGSRAEYDASIGADTSPASSDGGNEDPDFRPQGADDPDEFVGTSDEPAGNESSFEPDAVDPEHQCLFCSARCRSTKYREPDDVCGNCGSPLYPTEQRRFESDSQRAIDRIPKQMSAVFSLRTDSHSQHAGRVQDISLNGMQLHTDTRLNKGQIALIRTDVLDAVSRVVDSRRLSGDSAGPWRVGFVFLSMRFHRTRGSFVSVDV